MRGNYQIPNGHFHKDWQRFVRTWFNQPAKKAARRNKRIAKAQAVHPRPLNRLRPIVRCQTIKYNQKIRGGRGFTLDELEAAKIPRKFAPTIGISVDHRRKNRSEEAFQANVARLKLYRSKLVIFPRHPTSQRAKKGDATAGERKAAYEQNVSKDVLPLALPKRRIVARKITAEEHSRKVTAILRKELTDSKLWGAREQRAKKKAESAAAGKKGKEDEAQED